MGRSKRYLGFQKEKIIKAKIDKSERLKETLHRHIQIYIGNNRLGFNFDNYSYYDAILLCGITDNRYNSSRKAARQS